MPPRDIGYGVTYDIRTGPGRLFINGEEIGEANSRWTWTIPEFTTSTGVYIDRDLEIDLSSVFCYDRKQDNTSKAPAKDPELKEAGDAIIDFLHEFEVKKDD